MSIQLIGDELDTRSENITAQPQKEAIRVGVQLGNDVLLVTEDVTRVARCRDDVARDIIKETTNGIKAHGKLYVFDSDLHDYFWSRRGNL